MKMLTSVLVLIAAAAAVVVQADVSLDCPDGWTASDSTGSCIILVQSLMDWTDARYNCQSQGADLVKIESQEKNDLVASIATGQVFIGLYDRLDFGKWVWVVDHTEPEDFINWKDGYPENKKPYRVAAIDSNTGLWFNLSGYRGSNFVCELYPDSIPSS